MIPTILAGALALAAALPADDTLDPSVVVSGAARPQGPVAGPGRPRLLRFEYQGYESRLRVMERRIDQDQRYRRYSADEAARHRGDVAAIRARFHYRDERVRRMSRSDRDRFEADLRAQETGLNIVYRP
jgi:hypothetical protein